MNKTGGEIRLFFGGFEKNYEEGTYIPEEL